MIRQFLVGGVLLLACVQDARANGRAPATSTINFRRGMESHIAAGMTFGLLHSSDNGITWHWVCEDSIGYGGMYDPDYVFASSGALFATTFDGLKVSGDRCVFDQTSFGMKFVSAVTQGPDGAIYYGAAHPASGADPGDSSIYRSTDDGLTFPMSAAPGKINDWWQSLEVAPSDPQRLYLSGYRFVPNPTMEPGNVKVLLLFRSDNAGVSWTALPTTQLATMPNSSIEIAGISSTDPAHVYALVRLEDNSISDALYRSTDGGETWTRILGKQGALAFVARANGDLVAATKDLGAFKSVDNGDTWETLAGAPHISCLSENSAGELWACTQNYGSLQAPSDGYGIMKTTDLVTWSGVLRFEDIQEPLGCPGGTVQKDTCDLQLWCGLCAQLGCDPKRQCEPLPDITPTKDGCCKNSAAPAPGALVLVLLVGMILCKARRRRASRCSPS